MLGDGGHELVDERVATEEVLRVALAEGPQALVRVLHRREGLRQSRRVRSRRLRERRQELVHGLVPLALVECGCAPDHGVEHVRQLRTHRRERRQRRVHGRPLAGEQLEREKTEAVQVRARRVRPARNLLGRQVRRRAAHEAPRVVRVTQPGGDAEVRQVGVSFLVEEHVGGL